MDTFLSNLEEICSKCDIMLKKPDKRRVQSEQKQNLMAQLREVSEQEAGLLLHLALLLLFHSCESEILHASGKFVPEILSHIKGNLEKEDFASLFECQELVVKKMKSKDEQEKVLLCQKLEKIIPQVKNLGLNWNKNKQQENKTN